MSRSGSITIAYGFYLRNYDGEWMIQESEDDWEYEFPWVRGVEECLSDDGELAFFIKFLLRQLPEPPSESFLAEGEGDSYHLNKLLTELTGLSLEAFGFENSRILLASGPVAEHYTWGPVDIDEETLKVSDAARERLEWVRRVLGCTPVDKPGIKVMASYG